ncbi:MAG: GNAT family N-acetyltransferase [Gemmatimonadales bacterium]
MIRLAFLADHGEHVPQLARWHYDEWRTLMPEWSLEEAERDLRTHAAGAVIPTTVVAFVAGELAGSASLLPDDFPEWSDYGPWLASVFVEPRFRKQGVGRQLVLRIMELADGLGVPRLHLGTTDQVRFYQQLGWSVLPAANPVRPLTLMGWSPSSRTPAQPLPTN